MAEPRKISQEQYDRLRSSMEERYGYDKMSDADKARFDEEFDKTVTVDADDSDEPRERERGDEEIDR